MTLRVPFNGDKSKVTSPALTFEQSHVVVVPSAVTGVAETNGINETRSAAVNAAPSMVECIRIAELCFWLLFLERDEVDD